MYSFPGKASFTGTCSEAEEDDSEAAGDGFPPSLKLRSPSS